MNALGTGGGLESLEAAYQTLGQLISALKQTPQPGAVPAQSYLRYATPRAAQAGAAHGVSGPYKSLKCRSYIKYPSPQGLRPRAGGPFKVADLCRAYNFPTGLAGGGGIGILELGGGYHQGDLDRFSQLNSLPQIIPTDVPVNGGQNSPGSADDGEVLLDIEVTAAAKSATESGCVLFAASGDNSSGDGAPGANVDLPSSCPHIIGCGATTKTPFSEVVWGDGTPNGNGTGGGYSAIFPPQDWQVGAPPSPGQPGRMVPDVAADADPNTGYLVVINGQEEPVGGTSAVAPLYSGLFGAFGQKLGFVTPTLWQHPEAFVDITQGSNGSFNVAVGPDPCTGLGVPNGTALAALFAGRAHRAKPPAR